MMSQPPDTFELATARGSAKDLAIGIHIRRFKNKVIINIDLNRSETFGI